MVVLVAWSRVVAFRVLGNGRAPIAARLIVGVRGIVAAGEEFQAGHFGAGPGKGGSVPGFQGQGVGVGMSGVKFVGALGRDQTYVSAGASHAQERQWQARRWPVPGAGVAYGGKQGAVSGELRGYW